MSDVLKDIAGYLDSVSILTDNHVRDAEIALLKSKVADQDNVISTQKALLDAAQASIDKLKDQRNDLHKERNYQEKVNKRLLKNLREQYKIAAQKLNEQHNNLRKSLHEEIRCKEMECSSLREDLREQHKQYIKLKDHLKITTHPTLDSHRRMIHGEITMDEFRRDETNGKR